MKKKIAKAKFCWSGVKITSTALTDIWLLASNLLQPRSCKSVQQQQMRRLIASAVATAVKLLRPQKRFDDGDGGSAHLPPFSARRIASDHQPRNWGYQKSAVKLVSKRNRCCASIWQVEQQQCSNSKVMLATGKRLLMLLYMRTGFRFVPSFLCLSLSCNLYISSGSHQISAYDRLQFGRMANRSFTGTRAATSIITL